MGWARLLTPCVTLLPLCQSKLVPCCGNSLLPGVPCLCLHPHDGTRTTKKAALRGMQCSPIIHGNVACFGSLYQTRI